MLAVAVRRAASGLRRRLALVNNCSREAASDVTDAQASACDGRGGRDYLRDGSMVPGGSMMPLAKPPFDMICIGCCTCTEYIQAAQEQPSSKEASVERREAQRVANGRGAGSRARRTGIRSGRWRVRWLRTGMATPLRQTSSITTEDSERRGKCQNRWYKHGQILVELRAMFRRRWLIDILLVD